MPLPRLYLPQPMPGAGANLTLDKAQTHYLRSVMRRGVGDELLVFNGEDGEWLARIAALEKAVATLQLKAQQRPQYTPPPLALLFAPIKKTHLDFLIEKSVELGVTVLQPVMTQHVAVGRVNHERLEAQIVEAAEQSGRLDVPVLKPTIKLADALARPAEVFGDTQVILCAESGDAEPLATVAERSNGAMPLVLTGPEGGFAATELDALRRLPKVAVAGLGPRILRADTAALAALACLQALGGDWRDESGGDRRPHPATPL